MSSRTLSRALLLSSALTATISLTAMTYAQSAPKATDESTAPFPEPENLPPIGGECGVGPTAPAPIRPDKYAISPGGVDMRSGMYKYKRTDLSIGGEGDAGLMLSRSLQAESEYRQNFGGLFSHNWDIRLLESRVQVCEANTPSEYDRQFTIAYDGLGTSFRSIYTGTDIRQISNGGYGRLTFTGNTNSGTYTFTGRDGTKVLFRPMVGVGSPQDCVSLYRCSFASEVLRPDGTRYKLEYDTAPGSGSGRTRLRNVVSNRGFALLFEYNAPTNAGFNLIARACVINLATTPKPGNNQCPSSAQTAAYGYTGEFLTSATDASGAIHTQTITPIGSGLRKLAFYDPGVTSAKVTVTLKATYEGDQILSQSFADGTSYTYDWKLTSSGYAGGSYTNAAGRTVSVLYGAYPGSLPDDPTYYVTPGPEKVIDELGHTSLGDYCFYGYGYCSTSQLQSWTDPEGAKHSFTYDNLNNPTQVVKIAKPGSGLANLTENMEYGCGSTVCLDKPTSKTDARGNATTYTYDTTHGGMLTETMPADANGVQAVKRYAYAARHAWFSSAAGGYVQATTPVYLLTEERTCRTTATVNGACAGGAADEVVTTYDYGPNGGPNNLLLRGRVVSADGQSRRSCLVYDAQGNKIAESSPRAGLTVCQ